MITFDNLKESIDENHICKIQMPRKEEVLNNYKKFRENLDYEAFERSIFNVNINSHYVITKNDFPYDIEPNICHYILWLKEDQPLLEIEEIINNNFQINLKNLLYYRNSPENRSIASIVHYHIFYKK